MTESVRERIEHDLRKQALRDVVKVGLFGFQIRPDKAYVSYEDAQQAMQGLKAFRERVVRAKASAGLKIDPK